MMELTAEFKTRTFAGFADCKVVHDIFRNPRDMEESEKAIKWVKSVLTNGADAMVTFGYFDEHEYDFARLFVDYQNGIKGVREIHWNKYGNLLSDEFHDKLTTKIIRKVYIEVADIYIDHESEKGA